MNDIDEYILQMGTLLACEFTTKPVEIALETTRMLRAKLHETEKFKDEYERKMAELRPRIPFFIIDRGKTDG